MLRSTNVALSSPSERYGLTLTVFAAWRVDNSHMTRRLSPKTKLVLKVRGQDHMSPQSCHL